MTKKGENENRRNLYDKIAEIMEDIVLNYEASIYYHKLNLEFRKKYSLQIHL